MQNLVKTYTPFEASSYIKAMSNLRNTGLRPLSTADVIKERLEALNNKDLGLIKFWLDRYFDTTDGIAYSGDKRKVAYSPKQLLNLEPNTNLSNGALIITPDEYKDLEGEEFSVKELEKAGLGRRLSKEEVITHPVWLALARGDKHLLKEYRNAVFEEIKRRYNDSEGMSIYLGSEQKQPSMRAWAVDYLVSRSYAVGLNLNFIARLAGVSSKIAEGDAQNLVRTYTPEDVQSASEALKILKGVARPEIVEPLEVLVRKA